MGRFVGTCEEWNSKNAIDDEDAINNAAKEMQEIKDKISSERRSRFGFCTIALVCDKPEVVICDKVSFEKSISTEDASTKNLQKYIAIFNVLNPLFIDVQKEFPRLSNPTLKGLQLVRQELGMQKIKFENRLKNEFSAKLSSGSKGRTVDEMLKDPGFLEMKKTTNGYIKTIDVKITKCNEFINIINKLFEGE